MTQRLIRSACAIAAEEIGRKRAGRIAAEAQKRYEALCRENAPDSKALRAYTFARIYPTADFPLCSSYCACIDFYVL